MTKNVKNVYECHIDHVKRVVAVSDVYESHHDTLQITRREGSYFTGVYDGLEYEIEYDDVDLVNDKFYKLTPVDVQEYFV
jgi:hypothetical protein